MKLKSIALLLLTVAMPAMAEQVSVNTKGMSLILDVENGKPAQYLYFGTKLNNSDLQNLKVATDGTRPSHTDHAEVMFSLNGKVQENVGDLIGAALVYGGNYKLKTVTDDTEYHYFFAGINSDNSEYHLKKGETFKTPALALTYSTEGLSGASRNFHKWGRKYILAHGDQLRDILLNSWEGVYFDINQEGMDQMMKDIHSMGGELFVMDDGWFGNKYPRKSDNSSLGDWVVDTKKLPEGIEGLLRDAVLGCGGTQLVFDLSNPKVQGFVYGVVDNLLTTYPEIAYIKWDANMPIMNHGSQYLPAADQSHLYIAYHQGFAKVMERIRAKYKDVVIQCCASGGGRANWGFLRGFDEFWCSDNTDALQRVYMQYGTSYFLPDHRYGLPYLRSS